MNLVVCEEHNIVYQTTTYATGCPICEPEKEMGETERFQLEATISDLQEQLQRANNRVRTLETELFEHGKLRKTDD